MLWVIGPHMGHQPADGFATVGLVLRAFVAQLRHRLWRVGHELCASLRGNVRSDRLVALMQSERTGEAERSDAEAGGGWDFCSGVGDERV